MADDERPVEDLPTAIAALRKDFDDFRTTTAARANRLPTGSIEPTILPTSKADTLFMQGQIVSRAQYPVLWQWVQNNSLLAVGLFGPGDGSTTFGLPNMQGRVLLGAGTLGTDSYVVGAQGGVSQLALTVAQMPVHNHPTNSSGFTSTVGNHGHGTTGSTNGIGDHGGHSSGTSNVVPPGSGITLPSNYSGFNGGHNHTVVDPTFGAGQHNHTIDASNQNVGGGLPFDNRPPYVAVNWMIWV